ncbi:protein of unknown function [Xenorhabdus nematophila AN6/1]|nr:hypothetical protein XNA1_2080038 [Xenorhabdus nematophila str. Anatoliense]CEF33096.1 hypothetical protein XNW1_4610049 [Xenorhabdus nematophila str. Websteri]CEK24936.1 protein of unknown function [Xenorhabdus nematophila AN6/1]
MLHKTVSTLQSIGWCSVGETNMPTITFRGVFIVLPLPTITAITGLSPCLMRHLSREFGISDLNLGLKPVSQAIFHQTIFYQDISVSKILCIPTY